MSTDDLTAERIGRYYDEWTSRYRACFGDTLQACRPADCSDLHEYVLEQAGIRDGERLLDAGCGVCGPSVYFAAHRDISIDAVTVSGHQVAIGRQVVAAAGLNHKIRVHLADFHRLEELFAPDVFDRVVFLESLSHATDPIGPLRSVFHVLKPGGVVYIKDFFERSGRTEDEQRRLRETIGRVDSAFVLKTPTASHTIGALLQAGFEQQDIRPVGFDNDNSAWMRFNEMHRFDLYNGREPFQWCDWLELTFVKPAREERL